MCGNARITAALLKLLFMRKMLLHIIIKKLDCFIHRGTPLSAVAGFKQLVYRLDQFLVFPVYNCIPRFHFFIEFVHINYILHFLHSRVYFRCNDFPRDDHDAHDGHMKNLDLP